MHVIHVQVFIMCIFLAPGSSQNIKSHEDKKSEEVKENESNSSLNVQKETIPRENWFKSAINALFRQTQMTEKSCNQVKQNQVANLQCFHSDWAFPVRYVCFAQLLDKTVQRCYPGHCSF